MTQTHMRREINEIPEAVQRFFDQSGPAVAAAGAALREKDPAFLVTIARGSSDHASLFLKYAIELTAGRPVASIGPSLASIYGARLNLAGGAAIAISQSGKSPTSSRWRRPPPTAARWASRSPQHAALADRHGHGPCDRYCRPARNWRSGHKSYVSSIVAGLAILAAWTQDQARWSVRWPRCRSIWTRRFRWTGAGLPHR